MRLYGEIIPSFTTITSVDLAHYAVSRAKDWVSVDCGTRSNKRPRSVRSYNLK